MEEYFNQTCHDLGSFYILINMKLAELYLPLFLFTCLGYYIFSEFDLFCNIVPLLLLSVTMTNALSAPFYMHAVYIFMYFYMCCLCNYDYFHTFGSM